MSLNKFKNFNDGTVGLKIPLSQYSTAFNRTEPVVVPDLPVFPNYITASGGVLEYNLGKGVLADNFGLQIEEAGLYKVSAVCNATVTNPLDNVYISILTGFASVVSPNGQYSVVSNVTANSTISLSCSCALELAVNECITVGLSGSSASPVNAGYWTLEVEKIR